MIGTRARAMSRARVHMLIKEVAAAPPAPQITMMPLPIAVQPAPMRVVRAEDLVVANPGDLDATAVIAAACAEVRVAIAGTSLAVHFAEPDAAEIFGRTYRRMQTSLPAAAATWCAPIPDGYAFVRSDGTTMLWRGEPLRPHVVAFFVDAVAVGGFFAASADLLSIHASAFAWGEGMALVAGCSTAGKSTTTVALARRGVPIASDERCCVRDGVVLPFPRSLNLRAGGIALLAADRAPGPDPAAARLRALAATGEGAKAIALADLDLSDVLPAPAPLRAAFFIVGVAGEVGIERIAAADAVSLLSPAIQTGARGLDRAVLVHRAIAHAACYRVMLGTPDATAGAIVALGHAASGNPRP